MFVVWKVHSLVEALEINVAQKGLDFYSFSMKLGADCNLNEWIQREWHWEAGMISAEIVKERLKCLRNCIQGRQDTREVLTVHLLMSSLLTE